MEFELKIHKKPIYAVVTARGVARPQDFGRITEELVMHEDYFTGIGFLHDYRDVDMADLTTPEVRMISNMVASHREALGRGKWAILVNRDLEFGMARMWNALVQDKVDLVINIFKDESKARNWIHTS